MNGSFNGRVNNITNFPRSLNVAPTAGPSISIGGNAGNTYANLTTMNAQNHQQINIPVSSPILCERNVASSVNNSSDNILETVSRLANIADQLQKSMECRSEELGSSSEQICFCSIGICPLF